MDEEESIIEETGETETNIPEIGNILPEDDCDVSKSDSIFQNISTRTDNVSSDALVEDVSFVEEPSSPQHSSTPNKRQSPRLSARALSPAAPMTSSAQFPRPNARTRSRALCTTPLTLSTTQPAQSYPRTRARASSPAPSTAPAPQPCQSSTAKGSSARSGRLKCPKCPSTLANKKTLDTHIRGHVLKGVTSRAPNHQELLRTMERLVKEVLQEIIGQRVIGDLSAKIHKYCELLLQKLNDDTVRDDIEELCTLLSNNFFDITRDTKILFPSAIRSAFNTGQNALMSSQDFMTEVNSILSCIQESEIDVCNVFVGNFMLILCKRVQLFSIRHMRGVSTENSQQILYTKRSKDSIGSLAFRQLVYHIGGCVVGGFLWKGREYGKTSMVWTKYCDALAANFLVNATKSNQCSEDVRKFTESKDRGGLKHISDEAFSFFLVMFDTIMSLEAEDGSLPPNIIDDNILGSDVILCLWDSLAGSDLNQDEALDLLVQVSDKCVKIVKKGIMRRRLNDHIQKPLDSVAMRARLAS